MTEDFNPKKEYLKILLQQYSECWQAIRNDSNSVWQIPTLLITTLSVLGIAYAQLNQIQTLQPYQIQTGRILILLVGFGFVLVSLLVLVKHRASCNSRTDDFERIQAQLKKLLQQKEFASFFNEAKNSDPQNVDIQFMEIKFQSKDFAKEHRWLYCRSAYKWQRNLTISLLVGITFLLEYEFCLLGPFYLITFGIIPFLVFGLWLLIEKRIDETKASIQAG